VKAMAAGNDEAWSLIVWTSRFPVRCQRRQSFNRVRVATTQQGVSNRDAAERTELHFVLSSLCLLLLLSRRRCMANLSLPRTLTTRIRVRLIPVPAWIPVEPFSHSIQL